MSIANMIYRVRTEAKMTQAAFADAFGVSQQSVRKWENGNSVPELEKLIQISKRFGVSLDALILDRDGRQTEELGFNKRMYPQYAKIHDWEAYCKTLNDEFRQSMEEGLDIAVYEEVFKSTARLPDNEIKDRLADVLFDVVINARIRNGYPYLEPNTLENIRAERVPYHYERKAVDRDTIEKKIAGAWMGRICGCLLGKPLEGIRTDELIPFLKMTGNYPLFRYVRRADFTPEDVQKFKFGFLDRRFADEIDKMPYDDDTNYMILAQKLIRKFGRDFTPYDVSQIWLGSQPKYAYCTAERVAFINFVKGYEPPQSAVYKNVYREWIGAQIRADYYGYINPGDPETAAEMAWRDASISHVKNGIYGEMWVAAMIAEAAVAEKITDVIRGGLAQIPAKSRLYQAIVSVLRDYESGVPQEKVFSKIHEMYNEHNAYDWCHVIPNAMIVTASLLYGNGDYGKSICMAVGTGFDTDCNGATVGSILGMFGGISCVGDEWTEPIHDTLETTVFRVGTVKISDCVRETISHLAN